MANPSTDFDPDAYLAANQQKKLAEAAGFNPDDYLASSVNVPESSTGNTEEFSPLSSDIPVPTGFGPMVLNPAEVAQTVKNLGLEGGGAALGQAVGAPLAAFGGVPIGGAIGGFLGNAAAQLTTEGKEFKLGEALAAGAAGAVPGASLAKAGIKTVAKQAAKLGAANVAATNVQSLADTGELAPISQDLMAAGAGVAAAPLSKFLDRGQTLAKTEAAFQKGAVKRETLRAGRELGLVVPPSAVAPNLANDTLQSLAGKAATAQESILRNQPKINDAVAKEIFGTNLVNIDAPFSETALRTAKTGPNLVYSEIAQSSPEASRLLSAFKDAKDRARTLYSNYRDNPTNATLAAARAADVEADTFKAGIKKQVSPELYNKFDAARIQLAKINLAERAVNKGTGDIDIRVLGQALDNGEELTGNFKKLGKFQQGFAKYAQDAASAPPSGVDYLKGMAKLGLGGAGGYSAGGLPGAVAGMAAMAGAERGSRSMILSPFYQRRFAQPYYGPTTEDISAGMARLALMQQGRQ